MRLLILGGTVFLGRALTDAALAAGHEVTHFNRGRAPDVRVRTVVGDRASGDALRELARSGSWDAVIDTSGYLPQTVAKSCGALREAPRYLFVSSISVYTEDQGCDETSPVQPAPDPLPDEITPDKYGALKAACEATVRGAFHDRSLVVRPGLIVGPHDPTDRFTWWPHRVSLGGRVAAPGRPVRKVQFIDVRDLAEWTIGLASGGPSGTFNATGVPVAMAELLEACRAASECAARLDWIDEAFLAAHDVSPWKDMPVWLPEDGAGGDHFMKVPIARALATGLRSRALRETVADTLAWSRTRDPAREWKAGLTDARERALLAAWDARHAAD